MIAEHNALLVQIKLPYPSDLTSTPLPSHLDILPFEILSAIVNMVCTPSCMCRPKPLNSRMCLIFLVNQPMSPNTITLAKGDLLLHDMTLCGKCIHNKGGVCAHLYHVYHTARRLLQNGYDTKFFLHGSEREIFPYLAKKYYIADTCCNGHGLRIEKVDPDSICGCIDNED